MAKKINLCIHQNETLHYGGRFCSSFLLWQKYEHLWGSRWVSTTAGSRVILREQLVLHSQEARKNRVASAHMPEASFVSS